MKQQTINAFDMDFLKKKEKRLGGTPKHEITSLEI